MLIEYYLTKSPNNKLIKELESKGSTEGTLRDNEVSVTNPVIRVSSVPEANYCFIPEFKRYYYIDDVRAYRNNMWFIVLRCDVLMSFKEEILKLYACISQQEGDGNPYAADIQTEARNNLEVIKFNRTLDNPQLILITVRGK